MKVFLAIAASLLSICAGTVQGHELTGSYRGHQSELVLSVDEYGFVTSSNLATRGGYPLTFSSRFQSTDDVSHTTRGTFPVDFDYPYFPNVKTCHFPFVGVAIIDGDDSERVFDLAIRYPSEIWIGHDGTCFHRGSMQDDYFFLGEN